MKRIITLMALALSFAPTPGHAQQMDTDFDSSIGGVCFITQVEGGTLAPNAVYNTLTSLEEGGAPSTVNIFASSNLFHINTQAPEDFTQSPEPWTPGLMKQATYTLSGATTTANNMEGELQTQLNPGDTHMAVDLAIWKTSGAFLAGVYRANVVVICE